MSFRTNKRFGLFINQWARIIGSVKCPKLWCVWKIIYLRFSQGKSRKIISFPVCSNHENLRTQIRLYALIIKKDLSKRKMVSELHAIQWSQRHTTCYNHSKYTIYMNVPHFIHIRAVHDSSATRLHYEMKKVSTY